MSGSLFCSLCWWVWLRQAHTPWKRCEALSAAGEKCVPPPLRAEPVARSVDVWTRTWEGRPCGKVHLDVVSTAGQLGMRPQKLRRGGLPPLRLVVVGCSGPTPQPLISSADPGPGASCPLCPRPSVLPAVSGGQHNRPGAWMGDVGSPACHLPWEAPLPRPEAPALQWKDCIPPSPGSRATAVPSGPQSLPWSAARVCTGRYGLWNLPADHIRVTATSYLAYTWHLCGNARPVPGPRRSPNRRQDVKER